MLKRRALLAASATLPWLSHAALAAWPDRPIRVIVPFAAGGNTDVMTRTITAAMTESIGKPFIIEIIIS